MQNYEFWTLFGMIFGGVIVLYREMKDIQKSMKDDVREIRNETKTQSERTDRLYEMFIDLLKEGKVK